MAARNRLKSLEHENTEVFWHRSQRDTLAQHAASQDRRVNTTCGTTGALHLHNMGHKRGDVLT